ncbi:putative inactive gamma-glutamyltranspeptidase 4 [Hibiscus syriacus]|uniref:Inactive gamma-glutamyltranspeptidase 4 n=1 Tax=Hibiscus syriacus TaxID=106335 RepID=A0A6A3BHZ1_HIBSY|nr:putative inactive gamma-glutamyltranspeptidase 4 [Hibiscus syriacus]
MQVMVSSEFIKLGRAASNFVRTGERPLSSMTSTIVLKDGKLKAVVGASGGANNFAGTTQVFLNHFALGLDPFSSVTAPRVYHQLIPNVVMYEIWTTVIEDHFEVPAKISDPRKEGTLPVSDTPFCGTVEDVVQVAHVLI